MATQVWARVFACYFSSVFACVGAGVVCVGGCLCMCERGVSICPHQPIAGTMAQKTQRDGRVARPAAGKGPMKGYCIAVVNGSDMVPRTPSGKIACDPKLIQYHRLGLGLTKRKGVAGGGAGCSSCGRPDDEVEEGDDFPCLRQFQVRAAGDATVMPNTQGTLFMRSALLPQGAYEREPCLCRLAL